MVRYHPLSGPDVIDNPPLFIPRAPLCPSPTPNVPSHCVPTISALLIAPPVPGLWICPILAFKMPALKFYLSSTSWFLHLWSGAIEGSLWAATELWAFLIRAMHLCGVLRAVFILCEFYRISFRHWFLKDPTREVKLSIMLSLASLFALRMERKFDEWDSCAPWINRSNWEMCVIGNVEIRVSVSKVGQVACVHPACFCDWRVIRALQEELLSPMWRVLHSMLEDPPSDKDQCTGRKGVVPRGDIHIPCNSCCIDPALIGSCNLCQPLLPVISHGCPWVTMPWMLLPILQVGIQSLEAADQGWDFAWKGVCSALSEPSVCMSVRCLDFPNGLLASVNIPSWQQSEMQLCFPGPRTRHWTPMMGCHWMLRKGACRERQVTTIDRLSSACSAAECRSARASSIVGPFQITPGIPEAFASVQLHQCSEWLPGIWPTSGRVFCCCLPLPPHFLRPASL